MSINSACLCASELFFLTQCNWLPYRDGWRQTDIFHDWWYQNNYTSFLPENNHSEVIQLSCSPILKKNTIIITPGSITNQIQPFKINSFPYSIICKGYLLVLTKTKLTKLGKWKPWELSLVLCFFSSEYLIGMIVAVTGNSLCILNY